MERIRIEVQNYIFKYNGKEFSRTISFGACFCNDPKLEVDVIINTADENLYKAKRSGRNNIKTSVVEIIENKDSQ
ncbi:MAG: GGDEF domain-containing protein [Spirochaetales bacterium]|nr:GGDEF domain-containing protein [Spirochaetales bacterium]